MSYSFFSGPYVMWFVVLLGVAASFLLIPYGFLFTATEISIAIFIITFLYWMYFFLRGATTNLQAPVRPQHVYRIITKGVYAQVRHPMYSGDIVLAWGAAVVYPLMALWVSAAWLTVVMVLWAYLEEQILLKRFGDEYRKYKNQVPMWIPKIRLKK